MLTAYPNSISKNGANSSENGHLAFFFSSYFLRMLLNGLYLQLPLINPQLSLIIITSR